MSDISGAEELFRLFAVIGTGAGGTGDVPVTLLAG